jgi:hypothetical protein
MRKQRKAYREVYSDCKAMQGNTLPQTSFAKGI